MYRYRCSAILLVLAISLPGLGCSKDKKSNNHVGAAQPSVAKQRSAWKPDPAWAAELTETLSFDKYQLSAPKYLKADPAATKSAGPMNVFTWKIDSGSDLPRALLVATTTQDPKMVGEAKANIKRAMVNFTAGMIQPLGFGARRTADLETGSLAGMSFSRYPWEGTNRKTRTIGQGLTYGGVDGDRSILFVALCNGPNPAGDVEMTEAVLATLRKQ
jgi:hypothetical protein